MLGFIAVTDFEWYEYLSAQDDLDEVNFWRPSDIRTPRQIGLGTPILFKLRREHGDRIVGFGIFARHEVLPAFIAWEWFDRKNGAADFPSMRRRIERLRPQSQREDSVLGVYRIGCLMLAEPAFFPLSDAVSPPRDWPANAVQGKGYDLDKGEGARVWAECLIRSRKQNRFSAAMESAEVAKGPRYGKPTIIMPRLGQGIFRASVTSAYGRACAITGEHSLPVLEAAHIRPYGEGGEHEVPNGLLLRSDIHRLFDTGYVGVTTDYRFVVSPRLRDEFANGRSYYPLQGTAIQLPSEPRERPSLELLEWHLGNRFQG